MLEAISNSNHVAEHRVAELRLEPGALGRHDAAGVGDLHEVSMFPTSIEDLMQIADAGGIMPPKSTWFEPKLRDAMFCHMI